MKKIKIVQKADYIELKTRKAICSFCLETKEGCVMGVDKVKMPITQYIKYFDPINTEQVMIIKDYTGVYPMFGKPYKKIIGDFDYYYKPVDVKYGHVIVAEKEECMADICEDCIKQLAAQIKK